ncbi:MAG TPA: class I SAM-dependent methyltransferase [Thermoleophilia bacterium]|nr:class I SAM-dependent methyltransferase [Thermoleophilia bacterium]
MADPSSTRPAIVGELSAAGVSRSVRVVGALPRALLIEVDGAPAVGETDWQSARIGSGEGTIELGRCRYFPHDAHPHRRATDPPPKPGHGRLVPVDEVVDFRALMEKGSVVPLAEHVRQLPLIYRRKHEVSDSFRTYTSELAYDLQVFRSVLDEIDRSLATEPSAVAELVRAAAVASQWGPFCELFDRRLAELEPLVAGLSKQESELHGYYFRKHMWDLIMCSEVLARTNLKPRGYAGDSEMMRMVYQDAFAGPTVFSRFMHRHPIRTAAAQAVRNRRALLSELITARAGTAARGPLRVMSVACGPAREVSDIVQSPRLAGSLAFTLVDQDDEALGQARQQIDEVQGRIGTAVSARAVRQSVRTMLRTPSLRDDWGRFDVIYSMGLFDYLVGPVARAVLTKLYDLLDPGGELIIGNFHVGNPTRIYMEYWMDWVLFYRTEEEMLALAAGLPGGRARIDFEETRSQMFLRITKD